MARLSGIPQKLHQTVLDKSAEGWSGAKIRDWLKLEHSIVTSDRSVHNLLKNAAEERKDTAKQAYAKAVAESANTDIAIIGDKINKFNERVDAALKIENDLLAVRIAETLLKFVDRRMKMSGIDNKDGINDEELLDNLLQKLGK